MTCNPFLFTSNEDLQPRENVKITSLKTTPYPDNTRIRMQLTITPFQERPNLEIFAYREDGLIVSEMSVIETMTPNLDFTLYIRGVKNTPGNYILRTELYYDDRNAPQDTKEVTFTISDGPAVSA